MAASNTSFRLIVLLLLVVWTGGGCARLDDTEVSDTDEHTRSLILSFKYVTRAMSPSTKMTTEITQSQGTFRGIEQLYVVPFNTQSSRVEPEEARLGDQNVVLGNMGISSWGLNEGNNSHLFGSAFVPKGMNRVLVYGKSPDQGPSASKDSKHTYGVLTPKGLDDPKFSDDVSFHLEPILLKNKVTDEFSEAIVKADELLDQLNVVMSMMENSPYASIVSIFDAVKRENQILACSYATFDQIRTEIQTALLRIPFESMELVQEIGRVSGAVNTFSTVLSSAGGTYPASYGIPEGSIGFWWNGKEFVRLIGGVDVALVDPASYCYPPSLWYYANSSVQTSNQLDINNQYSISYAHWDDILNHYTDGQMVDSFTESVAISDPLEYGVGMLELSLSAPGAEAASLINECPLTGIIIGDQKDVDFRFLPSTGSSHYIYDNVGSTLRIGVTGRYVQTLVLQTVDNMPVHFALEFKNNTGYKRYCQQGDILPGCKFYLAGVLDPTSEGTQPANETLYSVFSRDHKTTVSVKVESLRNAYNTVPDLHSPQLEIGIVAEMKWAQLTPQSLVLDY